MTNEPDRFWTKMVESFQQADRLPPSTLAEAQADLDGAGELPVPEDLIKTISARVVGRVKGQADGTAVDIAAPDPQTHPMAGTPQGSPLTGPSSRGIRTRILYRWIPAGAAIAAGLLLAILAMELRPVPKSPSVTPGGIAPVTIAQLERRAQREQAAACLLASAEMLARYAGGQQDARKTLEYVQAEYGDTTVARHAFRAAETQVGGV